MLENILGQPDSHREVLAFHERESAQLEAVAAKIRSCKGNVIFTGMGASYFAAVPAVSLLQSKGIAARVEESGELLHYGSKSVHAGDVVVLISRSGGSAEVLRLVEKLKQVGATLIGVTNLPDTELERESELTLQIGSRNDQIVAIQSYAGTVLTLLMLAEQAATQSAARLSGMCEANLPKLTELIDTCLRQSEGWRELFDTGEAFYLLGRGAALASVHEGSLLLHETAKAAAVVGMSSGQFRHGPVESVSNKFRAVVFGSPSVTRKLDQSLASDLTKMGARVAWIGPEAPEGVTSLIAWPQVDELLSPIFEIVPMQAAAYQLAQWRGIVPGDFRFASEVTGTEAGFPLFQSKQKA